MAQWTPDQNQTHACSLPNTYKISLSDDANDDVTLAAVVYQKPVTGCSIISFHFKTVEFC